ncbi:MAG: ATP-binding protein [Marmoricola sp.]
MTRLRAVTLWLLVVATTAGSVRITMHTGVPAVWAANGIAVCAVLAAPARRRWAVLVVGTAVATTLGNLLGSRPPTMAVAFGLDNTAEVLAVVLVLTWRTGPSYALASWSDLRRTVAACALGAVVFACGSVAVLGLLGAGAGPAWAAWAAWSVGSHLAGTLVIVPLAARRAGASALPARAEVVSQVVVLAVALTAVCTATFSTNAAAFLLVPALLWAAARFPARWAGWELIGVAAVVIAFTLARLGPFVPEADPVSPHAMTTSVQTFLVLTALLTLAFSTSVSAERAAEHALRAALENERDLNHRLRQLDTIKSDFVANVSHELRTPLATIIGCTELLEDGAAGELSGLQADLVERMNRNSTRLLGLIEDLLTLGAVSDGRFAITATDVDLCSVVRQVLVDEVCPEDGRRVVDQLPQHPVAVGGDADQLVRLVGNLVGNALKFSPRDGRVTVAVRPHEGHVRLEVSDSGVGIAWEDQPLVFERFFRSRSSRDAQVPGTGLGLSIVRSIAEAHGAVAECDSTPGEGSTFTVTFPARSPVALAG